VTTTVPTPAISSISVCTISTSPAVTTTAASQQLGATLQQMQGLLAQMVQIIGI